jgi:aminoglycoside phosphotransferase (APT) family kinase protein
LATLLRKSVDAAVAAARLITTASLLPLDRLASGRDGSVPFDLSRISAAWLTRSLQPLSPGARVRGFRQLDHHSGTTTRARIAIDYDERGRGNEVPETIFVKIAPSAFAQRLFAAAMYLGRNEVLFYRTIRPELPVRAPRVWSAQVSPDGRRFAMLLEDLAGDDVRFAVVGDRADLALTRRVVGELAKLHAAFWESRRFADDLAWVPCRENRRLPDVALEQFLTRQMLGLAIRSFGKELPPECTRAARLCTERRDEVDGLWARGPRTLVHGDCHLGNLFFEGNQVGFFDWQVVGRAPGMRDVSYFLCNSCPSEIRAEHERELIALYLERLSENGVQGPNFAAAWEQHRHFALYTWLAAAFTAAAGAGLQAREIALAGLRRATRAIVELETVAAVERELGA